MPDQESNNSTQQWPMPAFYFSVTIDGIEGYSAFREISGLDIEIQPIEYRHGNSPSFSSMKMSGLRKESNVTLKKGVFKNDNKLFEWFNETKLNVPARKTVTIQLLDEAGEATMVWTLANAWPSKITGVSMKSDGNEVAVEGIELVHEGLTIMNGSSTAG